MAQTTTPRPPGRPRRARPQATTSASRTPRPLPTTRRTQAKRRPPSRAGRLLAALLLGLLAGVAMYGGYLYHHSRMLQTYLPALFRHGLHQPDMATAFPGKQTLNLLVIGRDADYSDSDQLLKSNGRSDMLMVARVDMAQQRIDMLSIPRDTLARIPGHGVTKINAAHKWGGAPLTARTISENYGIPTDQYVALDFAGFEKAIDLLGGVDLVVDKKMDYDDNWGHLHIHLLPGSQHLNGQQAMGFVRFRHSDSDLVRVQRQQALLAALKGKLREPQTLAHLPQLLDVLDAHLASDLSTDQKLALARFVHDTGRANLQMATLPSSPKGTNVATDWAKAAPLIQKMFGTAPPSEEMAEASGRHHHRRHRHGARLAELP